MGKLADFVASYVDKAIRSLPVITAVGTVVTSPGQVSTDPMTVVIDGSATSVPVKQVRGLPLSQGARVVLIKFGSDWTIVGSLTNPSVGTNTSRMVIGADTPAELKLYGIDTAILSYITDVVTGIEVGYFFIGTSNRFDGGGTNRVQAFGNVVYPTPGVPSSAIMSSVKTNFQQNMFAPFPQTIFKDQEVHLWTSMRIDSPNSGAGANTKLEVIDVASALAARLDGYGVRPGVPGTTTIETWHTITPAGGWSQRGAGFPALSYRYLASPAKSVQFTGQISGGTTTDATIITGTALPTGYRPTTAQALIGNTANVSGNCQIEYGTDGHLRLYGATGGTAIITINDIAPLDV